MLKCSSYAAQRRALTYNNKFRGQAPGREAQFQAFYSHDCVSFLTIYMKTLLDSDWLRAVQFKCNTSAKSVTSVQKV